MPELLRKKMEVADMNEKITEAESINEKTTVFCISKLFVVTSSAGLPVVPFIL